MYYICCLCKVLTVAYGSGVGLQIACCREACLILGAVDTCRRVEYPFADVSTLCCRSRSEQTLNSTRIGDDETEVACRGGRYVYGHLLERTFAHRAYSGECLSVVAALKLNLVARRGECKAAHCYGLGKLVLYPCCLACLVLWQRDLVLQPSVGQLINAEVAGTRRHLGTEFGQGLVVIGNPYCQHTNVAIVLCHAG